MTHDIIKPKIIDVISATSDSVVVTAEVRSETVILHGERRIRNNVLHWRWRDITPLASVKVENGGEMGGNVKWLET